MRLPQMNKKTILEGLEQAHKLCVEADAYIAGAARVIQGNADRAMLDTAIEALEKAKINRSAAALLNRHLRQAEWQQHQRRKRAHGKRTSKV